MGLFQRLFGRRGPEFTERIWLTTSAKIADLVAQVRASRERGMCPVTVVHFTGTLKLLHEALTGNHVRFRTVESPAQFPVHLTGEAQQEAETLVLLSGAIPASLLRSEPAAPKNTKLVPVSLHLAEHYPLCARDQQVLGLDRAWPMPMEFICYTALDEPWLAPFGVERIRQALGRLGMAEKTMLSHPQLSRSIRAAQQKIARQVGHEQACPTCEAWMRVNATGRL